VNPEGEKRLNMAKGGSENTLAAAWRWREEKSFSREVTTGGKKSKKEGQHNEIGAKDEGSVILFTWLRSPGHIS